MGNLLKGLFLLMALLLVLSGFLASKTASASDDGAMTPGSLFADCDGCPEMVVISAGNFLMGEPSETGLANEKPPHEVIIAKPFAVGITEVTYAQWDECVSEGGCTHNPGDDNWGRGNRAVANVNWADVSEFLAWISKQTGKAYRLLTEAEWEYAARAGTTTLYPWGNEFVPGKAVCLSCDVGSVMTIEVGQLEPNAFGLHDTVGSQKEWVQDTAGTATTKVLLRTERRGSRGIVLAGWSEAALGMTHRGSSVQQAEREL